MVLLRRYVNAGDIDVLGDDTALGARKNFHTFRRYMTPNMVWGWWPEHVSLELQRFQHDLTAGRRPKLVMMAPPQHGKSKAAEDLIAWTAGKCPHIKTVYASYSNKLAALRNSNIQRIMRSSQYQRTFPTRIGERGWTCNSEFIEFVGQTGSFRNTTVQGPINGFGFHLGVIDDPLKGRAEAQSKRIRDRTWSWFADDFMPRFDKNSGVILIMTRWHVDDPVGRFIEQTPGVRVLRYPAIAEDDEGLPHRGRGEPLFPEHKPLDFLLEQKRLMTQASWEAEYQQHPIVVGGGILPRDKLICIRYFDRSQILGSVRYWDKAGTEYRDGSDGAYTAGVLMHKMKNGTFVIENVVRGHWRALDREQMIAALAQSDYARLSYKYQIGIEQEPGSGGKESAEATIRNLARYRVFADRVTGSKEVRAEPFAAQVQAGNVLLVAGDWIHGFLDEAECFPYGKHTDQIDAAAGAFARLTSKPIYNLDAFQ